LASSEWVTGPEARLIKIVLHGLKGPVTVNGKVYQEPEVQPLMPGLKHNPEFTDEKLAAVLTYIRNAWTNEADPVEPATIKEIRESTIEREEFYTEKELLQ
jgi:mono/diheme cytochrome c family protein